MQRFGGQCCVVRAVRVDKVAVERNVVDADQLEESLDVGRHKERLEQRVGGLAREAFEDKATHKRRVARRRRVDVAHVHGRDEKLQIVDHRRHHAAHKRQLGRRHSGFATARLCHYIQCLFQQLVLAQRLLFDRLFASLAAAGVGVGQRQQRERNVLYVHQHRLSAQIGPRNLGTEQANATSIDALLKRWWWFFFVFFFKKTN